MTRNKRSADEIESKLPEVVKKKKVEHELASDDCQPSTSQQIFHEVTSSNIKDCSDSEVNCDTTDDNKDDYNILISIPLLVLTNIVDYLSVSEVINLAYVNKYLYNFVRSNYNIKVTLEGSPSSSPSQSSSQLSTSQSSSNLSVLDLTVSYNISQLPTDLISYTPFSQLNLRKLKQLKVVGRNHIWNKQYLLSESYKNTIEKLLTTNVYFSSIQKLEFLVDESKRSVEIVKLCRFFPNLKEVTLHGIGYFGTGSFHMDKEVAQNIITALLHFTRIKILHLKSFDTLHRCIVIESDTLEELHAEFGKCFEIGLLYLPRARRISLETSIWAGCFYHAQNGELKKIVSQGCPRLETFNNIDLTELAKVSESRHWLDQLARFCSSASLTTADAQCILCRNSQM